MNKILGFISFVLIVQGVGGVVHHFSGWFDGWGLIARVGFLEGYEIFAACALVVLGVAVGAASDKVGSRAGQGR